MNIAPKIHQSDLTDFTEQKKYQSVNSKVYCQSSLKLYNAVKSTRKLEIMTSERQKSKKVVQQIPFDKLMKVYDDLQKTEKGQPKQFLNSNNHRTESSQICQGSSFVSTQVLQKSVSLKRVANEQQSTLGSEQQLRKTLKIEPTQFLFKQPLQQPLLGKAYLRQQNINLRKQNEKLKLQLKQFEKIKSLYEDIMVEMDYLQKKCKHYQEDLQSYKLLVSRLSQKEAENSNNNIGPKVISKILKTSQALCTEQSILSLLNCSGKEFYSNEIPTLHSSHKSKSKVVSLPLQCQQIWGSPTEITFQKQCSFREKSEDMNSIESIYYKGQDFEILELSRWDEIVIEGQVLFGIQFFGW